jgi:hypothetical protein
MKGTAVKGRWSPEEDTKLIEAVTKCGKDWVALAALIPGRTNFQCVRRWFKSLEPDVNRGKWSPEEDAKLTRAVKIFCNGWVEVATLVPGRTNVQCNQRWASYMEPTINGTLVKGKWAVEEDAKLIKWVKKCGKQDWVAVAALVPGRSSCQCNHRWVNYVGPSTTKGIEGKWTAEEDVKLIGGLKKFGNNKVNWVRVTALIPGRTNFQCRKRWADVGPIIKGTAVKG